MNRAIKYLFSFRCVALLCALFFLQQSSAQTVPVYGDSTRLSKLKNGAGNELIIESSTKNIAGALVNYANGRTHFKLVLDTAFSVNDSTLRFRFTDNTTKDIVIHGTGGVTVETDPVATAKTITITGSSDVPVTGGTQTIGANPSYTIGSVTWANGFPTYDLRYASLLNSDFIASGGIVTWISGYTYNVSPAVYYINGVRYTSPSTNITLSAADATFDRIDVFALTTSGTAVAITGTPTSNPEKPDIDNNTQIEASFAVVEHATTQPTINQEWIYRENADWTTAVSNASINPNSTNSPFAGSKDVEGTAVANTHNITCTRGTSLNISTFSNPVLSFEIKSKASWGTNKKFTLQWFNGTTAVGNAIPFGDQSYGFVSSSTSSYFLVSIPLKDFGALSTVTRLRMQAANTTGTFGFFIDNIQIQSVTQTGTTGIQTVLGASPINVTTSGNTATVSLNNSGITPGTYNNVTFDAHGIATGGSNLSYLTGNQSITISGDATGTGTTSIPLTLATVNASPGTFGSASQSLTGTVNGKGLLTSLSAQNIQIAESQVTNLTTDLSGKQASLTGSQGDMIYFSATNALASLAKSTTAHQFISSDGTTNNPLYETINSDWITEGSTNRFHTDARSRAAISLTFTTTGTSGAATGSYDNTTGIFSINVPQYSGGGGSGWPLSGTGTLTGVATITSNTANQHVFNGTWTATANSQDHWLFNPSLTARSGAVTDTLNGIVIAPTITTASSSNQWHQAVNIEPMLQVHSTNVVPIALRIQGGMLAIDSIGIGDRKSMLSVSLNDDFDSAWGSQFIVRAKRNTGFFRVIQNRNLAGQTASPFMEINDGTQRVLMGAGQAVFNYGNTITLNNEIHVGSSGSVYSTNYLYYPTSYMIVKSAPGSNYPVIMTTSNSHLLVGGTQTDTTYRMFVNGDTKVRGDFVVRQLPAPPGGATIVGTAGTTTITYKLVGKTVTGKTTDAGATITTTTANATLSSSNYVKITATDLTFSSVLQRGDAAAFYDVYRMSTNGTSPISLGKIGTIDMSNGYSAATAELHDTGLSGDGNTTLPTANTTGSVNAAYYKYFPFSSAQLSAMTGLSAGDTFYCSDCTANDASTGVLETWNGSAFKKQW